MENSIILIIDFFSRNSTVGEKEWKNSKKKKSSGVGGWRGGLRKKYDFCTHISSRWKMKVLLSPFIIFHAWNFAGLLSSRQTGKRWKSVSRSTVYLCMAIHSLLLQASHTTTPNQVIYWRRRMMKRNSLHLMPYFISFIPFPPNFLPSQLGSLHHVEWRFQATAF